MQMYINNNTGVVLSEEELFKKLKQDALVMWEDSRNDYPLNYSSFDQFYAAFVERNLPYFRKLDMAVS